MKSQAQLYDGELRQRLCLHMDPKAWKQPQELGGRSGDEGASGQWVEAEGDKRQAEGQDPGAL